MSELWSCSARELATGVRDGRWSALEVVDAHLERIERREPSVGAFLEVDAEGARTRAHELDRRRAGGERLGALAGVPVALKDNLSLQGRPLRCASRILDGYVAPYTATAVKRLLAADAVPVGRVNMDEFAMGSSCENSALEITRNPWNRTRVPGGSSGGSAAAVAAREVPISLGSDTGGSIRQPAAFCGVVGVKPTYGRVSRYGLVAFASSLDQIGPLARDVTDAALVLSLIAGADPHDSTCRDLPPEDFTAGIDDGIAGLRLGVVEEVGIDGLAPDVKTVWDGTLERLEEAGAEIRTVSVPNLPASVAAYYVLANSEASANLARFDGARYGARAADARGLDEMYVESRSRGFGAEVKRRIMLGTYTLSSGYYDRYYGTAVGVVRALRDQIEEALREVDLLLTPTTPSGAFPLGEKVDDPLAMYLSDVFTTPASLVGLPAVAVPVGADEDGLPLSLQIVGRACEDGRVLRAARAVESLLGLELSPPEDVEG